MPEAPAQPLVSEAWRQSAGYLRGFALFNAGYYWEAHEAWEGLWLAAGRHGPIADLLQALIKLAAAGLKIRLGQLPAAASLATAAAEQFAEVAHGAATPNLAGMSLVALEALARGVANNPGPPGNPQLTAQRVFAWDLAPGDGS